MSDFFLSIGAEIDVPTIAAQLRWTQDVEAWTSHSGDISWILARVDDPALWAPAVDRARGLHAFIVGRFAFEESEWRGAEQLPQEGGLASRLVLNRWSRDGARALEQLNGAGIAVVIDERSRELHLWTDRLGFIPAFIASGAGSMVCSHPDVLAAARERAGSRCRFDALTLAEFLRTGTATYPHTYWEGVEQLEPGTHYEFKSGPRSGGPQMRQYWRPPYFDEPYLEDRHDIASRLAEALNGAVKRRTLDRLGKTALLLSSGADSRVALFGASVPSDVTCFTMFDEPNQELRGSKALAAAAGARHVEFRREAEYYFENARRSVELSGGMWSVESAHHTGLAGNISPGKFATVLTGCYADYLLKGIAYNRRPRTLLGRSLPVSKFAPFSYQWHHAHVKLGTDWDAYVDHRLDVRYGSGLETGTNAQSKMEYLRLAPIVREPDASGRLVLQRCTALDIFMSDNAILDLFGRISPKEKLNGIPFGMAVSRVTGERHGVANSNYSAPVGAQELGRVWHFLLSTARRKLSAGRGAHTFERDPRSIATHGSWPNYSRAIMSSRFLPDWQSSQSPSQREFLFSLLGPARQRWSIADWANRDATLFMRYFTASLWLDAHPDALSGRLLEGAPL